MGIHNREYMRDDSSPGFRPLRGRDIVKTLIIINVIVFVAQLALTQPMSFNSFRSRMEGVRGVSSELELRAQYEQLREMNQLPSVSLVEAWFALEPAKVLYGQIWRLTTYDFLHATEGIWHLLFNMLILYMAGKRVEGVYGPSEFLAFYLTAGILSGVTFLVWGLLMNNPSPAIGASGAVVAVMIVYAMHWPQERWYIFGIIPMPVVWIAILAAAWDLFPMLQELGGQSPADNVAHAAHLGGMAFGFLYVRNRWRVTNWLPDLSRLKLRNPLKRRPKLRVHHPVDDEPALRTPIPPDVEARVDQLLVKISEQGEASLTREERRFLADTSRQYRNRQ